MSTRFAQRDKSSSSPTGQPTATEPITASSSKTSKRWDGFVYEITIYGLVEPLYRYKVEDFQMLLSALTRGGEPKFLYIEYDYSGDDYYDGESFVKIVDPEFRAFLEKKGKIKPSTDEVDKVDKRDLEEFLKQKNAISLFIIEIGDGEDVATVVATRY
ncbi:MAG: hypothetical protein ACO2PN_16240 [Pyrobaculum sp.]|jgi:hypothetical protein